MKLAKFCSCGGALTGSTTDQRMAAALESGFKDAHSGEGHGPASREQAAQARRRERLREQREHAAELRA